jgi:hypothetical protein
MSNAIVPTAPDGNSTNQAASTQFVARAVASVPAGPAINPVAFGADPTGVNDSTAAFNEAIAVNGSLEFPAGKFRFDGALSYTIPNGVASVSISGQGRDVTILFWPNAGGGLTINYQSPDNTAHVSDLSFTTGVAAGGTGLALISDATQGIAVSDVYRVTFRGDDGYGVTDYWNTGVVAEGITNLNFEGVMVQGTGVSGTGTLNGNGLILEGVAAASTFAVQVNVAKSVFQSLDTGILYGSFLQGLTVDATNFTVVKNGIISNSSEIGTLSQLCVTNSQIGLFNDGGASIATFTPINNTMISNNFFFFDPGGSNNIGLDLSANSHFNVYGNQFASGATTACGAAIFIGTTSPGAAGVIAANDIFSCNIGVALGTGSAKILVSSNTFEGNTAAVTNNSTSCIVINNPGFNPVGASSVAPASSP